MMVGDVMLMVVVVKVIIVMMEVMIDGDDSGYGGL
jgi:hypothetical protein